MLKSIFLGAIALALASARAEAVVYSFTPEFLDAPVSPYLTPTALSFVIAIDDAAVRSGAFTYDYRTRYVTSGTPPRMVAVFSAIGDVQSLQSFRTPSGSVAFSAGDGPKDSSSAYSTVDLKFDQAGQVAGGTVQYASDGYYVLVNGTNQLFSGTAGIGFSTPARVTGALLGALPTSVPEPTTIALLGAALGMVVRGRQRRRDSDDRPVGDPGRYRFDASTGTNPPRFGIRTAGRLAASIT